MARSRAKQKEAKRTEKEEKRTAKRMNREREAAATIIDLRRASARERMACSRAKKKEAKHATERRIREREVEGTAVFPMLTTTTTMMGMGTGKTTTGMTIAPSPTTTKTGAVAGAAADGTIMTTGMGKTTTGTTIAPSPTTTTGKVDNHPLQYGNDNHPLQYDNDNHPSQYNNDNHRNREVYRDRIRRRRCKDDDAARMRWTTVEGREYNRDQPRDDGRSKEGDGRSLSLQGGGGGREDGAYDCAAARSSSSSYTPGFKGRKHGEGSQQCRRHRDDGSEGSTNMGCELVGLVNSREIICTVIMPTASLESCCYSDFLSHNHSLIKIAKEIFDDLFCNPIRTPWSEGKGIVISGDSCYGNPIKINIHRPSYLRQN